MVPGLCCHRIRSRLLNLSRSALARGAPDTRTASAYPNSGAPALTVGSNIMAVANFNGDGRSKRSRRQLDLEMDRLRLRRLYAASAMATRAGAEQPTLPASAAKVSH
jgi:hypothetical protein